MEANKRGAGKGGIPSMFNIGHAWLALPEHYLQLFRTPGNPCFRGRKEPLTLPPSLPPKWARRKSGPKDAPLPQ